MLSSIAVFSPSVFPTCVQIGFQILSMSDLLAHSDGAGKSAGGVTHLVVVEASRRMKCHPLAVVTCGSADIAWRNMLLNRKVRRRA